MTVEVRNISRRKGLYRTKVLAGLAERVCAAEKARGTAELSVLLCDDAMIHDLNRRYRKVDRSTDVLSFSQTGTGAPGRAYLLGDIVISLETVERRCGGDRPAMRGEVVFLFCHGLLHLLGYDHATAPGRAQMAAKQADYLGLSLDTAWLKGSRSQAAARVRPTKKEE